MDAGPVPRVAVPHWGRPLTDQRGIRRWRESLKLLLGLVLLVVLAIQVEVRELVAAFTVVAPVYLAPALAAFVALLAVQAWRLHLLVRDQTGTYRATLRLVVVGFFFNNLLPSTVGGDAYKVASLQGGRGSWGASVGLVGVDRVMGLGATALVGLVAALAVGPSQSEMVERLGWRGGPGPSTAMVLVLLASTLAVLVLIRRSAQLRGFFGRLAAALGAVSPGLYLAVFLLSLLAFGIRLARFGFYLHFFGVSFPLAEVTVVLAVVTLLGVLPLGFGGLGIQEGAIAYGFVAFGAPLELGMAVAVLNRAVIWVFALLGGVLFLWPTRSSSATGTTGG